MPQKDENNELEGDILYLESLSKTGNTAAILAHAAVSLARIAHAQEKLTSLAEIDLQQQVEAEIQVRAEQMAEEIVESKTKRSFIGKG